MPSADFCNFLPPLLSDGSLWQSCRPPRVMRSHLPSFVPPHLRTSFPYRYRTLKIVAFSSSLHASYAISVRQTSALPAASFRFHLAMDTLAVRLTIPPVGFVGDFHSLVRAPCRAHDKKAASGAASRCSFGCRSLNDYHSLVFIEISQHHFNDLTFLRWHMFADVIRLNRQFAMFIAAIN